MSINQYSMLSGYTTQTMIHTNPKQVAKPGCVCVCVYTLIYKLKIPQLC